MLKFGIFIKNEGRTFLKYPAFVLPNQEKVISGGKALSPVPIDHSPCYSGEGDLL